MIGLLLASAALAGVPEFEAWLDAARLDAWRPALAGVLARPGLAAWLARELDAPSAWEEAVRQRGRLDLQLVDVVPVDAGWQAEPLDSHDLRVLAREWRRLTGLPAHIELIVVPVEHEATWTAREGGRARTFVPGPWIPPGIDPTHPWLATWAATRDASGRRVIVSASGGRPDEGAWLGNTARPVDPARARLYVQELLHALGHMHHYAPGLYEPGTDRRDGSPFLVSTDCIMASGYVSGMAPLLCPICRYRLNPEETRRWWRRYQREARWLHQGSGMGSSSMGSTAGMSAPTSTKRSTSPRRSA